MSNIQGDEKDYLKERVDDHEERLRKLEESDIRQQIQLSEIQKSQADIKLLVMETSKEQNRNLQESNKQMLDAILGSKKNKEQIKLTDRKEVWAIVSAIITGIIVILTKIIS